MRILNKSKKQLVLGIFCLIIGFALLISIITRDKIYSKNDLVEINTRLNNYSFSEYGGYLSHIYSYHLALEKYTNDFIILTDYVRCFNKPLFEQSLRLGDSIIVEIYSKDFKNLSHQKKVRIYGLSDKNRTYMNFNDTMKALNSPAPNFFAAAFLIAGIIALLTYFDF